MPRRAVRRLRRGLHPAPARGGRVPPAQLQPVGMDADLRRIQRQALAGLHVVEAVLPLQRPAVARRRSRPAAAAARAQERPQPCLAAPQQRRHHLDAGQVGVPLVRGLGSRLPLRRAGGDRRRVRQAAARPARPRVVPAPQRPDSRLRVGLRRRQPAGVRLGGVARVRDRPRAARPRRHRFPRARLPQAVAQLHLVGEPQGRRGQQRLRGRLPRPRQRRRLRPQRAAAHRRLHRAERRHQLDGRVLAQPA